MAGWILFAVAAVAVLALLGFLYLKKHRGQVSKSKTADVEDEKVNLLPPHKDLLSIPDGANYVDVHLERSDNKFITIVNNRLRDAPCDFPDGDKVTSLTAVRGTCGFASGKHYWEVSLVHTGAADADMPPKQSWWIGVTNLSEFPKDFSLSPTVDNGFWFLSSSHDNAGVLQFSSNPPIYLGFSDMPQKVGVFVDYDRQELGFYDVGEKTRSLIGFFLTKFSGKVFPFFNPGKNDRVPMEIIHKNQEDKSIGTSQTVVD